MEQRSRTLRRLGVAGLSATLVVGVQAVGLLDAGSAFAATGGITITSQFTGNGSTANDGTNTSIKISANPTGAVTDVARVEFTVQKAGGDPTILGNDATAPYSIEWSPATSGSYTETATAYNADNTKFATSASKTVTVSATADAVHIAAPAEGGQLGIFTGNGAITDGGAVAVGGTRSIANPAINVNAASRDNTDGTLSDQGPTAAVPAGTGGTAAQQAWKGVVTVPAGTTNAAGNDVVLYAATASNSSDEVTEATLYKQTVTTFDAPANQTVVSGASTSFVLTALDQNGKPVAGLKVTAAVAANSGAAASLDTASPQTTDANGQVTFKTTAPDGAGSSTFTFRTNIDGTYVVGTDFNRTATLSYGTQTPTTLAFKLRPTKAVYAGQTEYTTATPVVDVCVTDQGGSPITATSAPTNLIVTDTRKVGTDAAGAPTTPTLTNDTTTGFTNCYTVSHAAADGTYGMDTFAAYLETNGTPGQQSSENGATVTTKWANLAINNGQTTNTQGGKGANVAGSFTVAGADGTPFANRKINLTLTNSGGTNAIFPATQPAGTTVNAGGNTAATCTTDANGVCAYNVTEPANGNASETVTVTALDSIDVAGDQKGTTATAAEKVRFENVAPQLANVVNEGETVVYPDGHTDNRAAEPGTIIVQTVRLNDQTASPGTALANVPVTITTDNGFFTDIPQNATDDGYVYEHGAFDPAISAGAATGNVKPSATPTTFTGTTNNNGDVTFAMSIGRNAGFDDDGQVLSTLQVSASGGTKSFSPATGANSQSYTWTTDGSAPGQSPLNPGSVKLVPVSPSTTLSGLSSSDFNDAGPNFTVHLTDQFGNLVRSDDAADVTLAGPATFIDPNGQVNARAKANYVSSATEIFDNGNYTKNPTVYHVYNNATSTAKSDATITATWKAPTSVFKATTTPPTPPSTTPVTTYSADNTGTATSTDSFTVSEYAIDENNLHYVYKVTPADIVASGTTVHDVVTVTDQFNRPVTGLYVNFDQSGPLSTDDFTSNQRTNALGQAGYNFSSAAQGNATVTATVYDCDIHNVQCSGIPLSESVNKVAFDGVPTLKATSRTGTGKVTVSGTTRPGASVQLLEKTSGSTAYAKAGAPIKAAVNGTFSFSPSISKTTSFQVRVDNVVTSATATATVKAAAKKTEKPVVTLSSQKKGVLGVGVVTSPIVKHKIVRLYSVAANGARTLLARIGTGDTGRVFTRFNAVSGKTYKIQAYVVSPTGYVSAYSTVKSIKVK